MCPVKLTAKQVLFNYRISGSPADSMDKVLLGEGIQLCSVVVDDDSCGMYCFENGQKKIYINQIMNGGRINFTIAHELGHHCLSHTLNEFCHIYRKLNYDTHAKDPQEVEANYFAACFLMPYDLVTPLFNAIVFENGLKKDTALNISREHQYVVACKVITTMEKTLKVSKEAAFFRLKGLDLLKSQSNYDEMVAYR
jgi:Zn-dependent peptidase ImmA (M78 family)